MPLDREAFATAFALAARRAGRTVPEPAPTDGARLRAAGVTWPVASWGLDGLTRSGLLLHAAAGLAPGELEALVEECFLQGDTRERQAVLRTLRSPARSRAVRRPGRRGLPHARAAGVRGDRVRQPVSRRALPEASFNQMVLKALFIEVAVGRIVGLEGRITPELVRMAADYASERRAAGRSVPDDVAYLLGENGSRP